MSKKSKPDNKKPNSQPEEVNNQKIEKNVQEVKEDKNTTKKLKNKKTQKRKNIEQKKKLTKSNEKNKKQEKKENEHSEKKEVQTKESIKNEEKNNENLKTDENKSEEKVKLIKFEEIKNIFRGKKAIPKEDKKIIRKPIIKNFLMAISIIIYFGFIILGFYNIDNMVYQTDLKVFSLCILFFAIILLERAYKKDNGQIAIFGIETIGVAIVTLALIYVNLMFSSQYINIIFIIMGIFILYYIIKSIIVYIKGRNKYFVNNMKEMINDDDE